MYKFFFLLLLLCGITTTGFHQPTHSTDLNQIPWNADRQLDWDDFRATPDHESGYTALTAWAVGYSTKTITRGAEVEMDVEVKCYFDPTQSWVKRKMATNGLLQHEQTHFNIGELLARDFRRRIKEATFSSEKPLNELEALYDQTFLDHVELSNQYDRETTHGLDGEAQAEWDILILDRIKALDKYRK